MSNFGFNFYLSNRLFLELAREYQLYVRYEGKRHVCRQSSFYASYSTLHAHISVFHLTSARPNLDTRFEWHPPCAHVGSMRRWGLLCDEDDRADQCNRSFTSPVAPFRMTKQGDIRMTRPFLNHRYYIVHEM